MAKKIVILGSTGSIGTSAMDVLANLKDTHSVEGLVAGHNIEKLTEQAWACHPRWICALDTECLKAQKLPPETHVIPPEAICQAVQDPEVDMVLCAIVGTSSLKPVLAAIEARKTIALATKEIMVMAGQLVTRLARQNNVPILPVDSEHCAVHQCLDGHSASSVRRIILTCSGGPFHAHPEISLRDVTLEQTLKHPTWNMGNKITIDCATLMNKGLELIEAKWLFGVQPEKLDVVIHPQSIVHSMVEYCDASILAQLGNPDMRLPIQYCLTYPARIPSVTEPLDFKKLLALSFMPPDESRFHALRLARQAMAMGGAAGAVFNAANEVAVERFVQKQLRFDAIPDIVERTLNACAETSADSLEDILEADGNARRLADSFVEAIGD